MPRTIFGDVKILMGEGRFEKAAEKHAAKHGITYAEATADLAISKTANMVEGRPSEPETETMPPKTQDELFDE